MKTKIGGDKVKKIKFALESLNVGLPRMVLYNGREIVTGIYKEPVEHQLFLSKTNLEGDGQADLVHHGGEDKAVCVYSFDHYSYWEDALGVQLEPGAFGENLTIRGLTEENVFLGDVFQFGDAIVEVSQPRQPCFKLAMKHQVKDLPVQIQNTKFTGFYFRVLKEGRVSKEDGLELIESQANGVSITAANQIKYHDKQNTEAIKRILEVKALSDSWRSAFEKRL
ncbi:MOSC domain-containing protein [Metabacillus idriensis]|uniref:MOSC domain-containing protein n=1 Tax=Metabacillus idriensis TaxID=324768 RepID=UPI002814563C|nr:MOSC domain-containing protein [Metabacillus idriensis]MDR0139386.1 MOSC domain-containing protein [Metabacillus idriensis]